MAVMSEIDYWKKRYEEEHQRCIELEEELEELGYKYDELEGKVNGDYEY